MTITAISHLLKLSWDVVKDMIKDHFQTKYIDLKGIRRIAIDEIAVKKGHKYMTVVSDLDRGKAVFVGKGRSSDTLIPFWKRVKRSKVQIEAVAIDMSPAFKKSVAENAPDAILIFDHFHITQRVNTTVGRIRKQVYNEEKAKVIRQYISVI